MRPSGCRSQRPLRRWHLCPRAALCRRCWPSRAAALARSCGRRCGAALLQQPFTGSSLPHDQYTRCEGCPYTLAQGRNAASRFWAVVGPPGLRCPPMACPSQPLAPAASREPGRRWWRLLGLSCWLCPIGAAKLQSIDFLLPQCAPAFGNSSGALRKQHECHVMQYFWCFTSQVPQGETPCLQGAECQ